MANAAVASARNERVNARVLGIGHHVPERVVTNRELAETMAARANMKFAS